MGGLLDLVVVLIICFVFTAIHKFVISFLEANEFKNINVDIINNILYTCYGALLGAYLF